MYIQFNRVLYEIRTYSVYNKRTVNILTLWNGV